MNNNILNNYDLFLKNIKIIENNFQCGICNDITLVNTNPFSYEFLCCKCGNFYCLDEDEVINFIKKGSDK